jgi:hypothetical protein
MLRSKQTAAAQRQAEAADLENQERRLKLWQARAGLNAARPTDDVIRKIAREAVQFGVTDEPTAAAHAEYFLGLPLDQRVTELKQFIAPPAAPAATPADVATMKALGFPQTPQGYEQFRAAQRQERMLSPEEEAQRVRIAQASRPPAQPREPAAPTIAQIQDPTDPGRMITIDARRYAGGGVGSPGVIGTSGKAAPVAAAEQKKLEGNAQLQTILDTLQTAYADLDAQRAIPSEQRNAVSNVLASIASSGVGQVAGRAVGTQAQTQRDVIQNARNLLFTAIKNATGKTSGELNSNVEFRTWIDALTDPSRSIQANQAILENLEKFVASGGTYSARKSGGAVTPPSAPTPTPAPAPTLTPQDKQALDWANANPKDPRAAQIKQRLGVQ